MKRKTVIILSSAVMLGTILTAVIFMRSKPLGNIDISISDCEAKTASSEISFKCSKGDRIKIDLNTNIKSGTVNFVLYNSKGGVIENLGTAKAYSGFVDLEFDDTCTLAAEYTDFTGSFSAKISKKYI